MNEQIRQYLAGIGSKGGKSGQGQNKRRSTSFNSKRARAAIRKRWAAVKRQKGQGKKSG
jgi:hypothetical protein